MINQKTFDKLKSIPDKEWGMLYKRLVAYAASKLKRIGFERRSEIDNVSAEDFVGSAIEKLFDGTRAWDFERFPDLDIHLKGIVKSLISSHIKSSSKKPAKEQLVSESNVVDHNEDIDDHLQVADTELDEVLILEEHWSYIDGQFVDDDDGLIIFYDWLDNIPPREIASKYGKDISFVYNAMKRGKRVIASLSKLIKNV